MVETAPPASQGRCSARQLPVPVAVIWPVEVPVHVMAIEAIRAEAMVDAHRLEAVPEAARFRGLHEGHTGDRHSCQRPKNKSHHILPGLQLSKKHPGKDKKSQMI